MKIVIAAPLYPPEITEAASYAKEVARRLSASHKVTVVAYTHLPEMTSGVRVVTVDKRRPLPLRLFAYFRALLHATRDVDVVYVMNGASVELPVVFLSLITRRRLVMCFSDKGAHRRAAAEPLLRGIEKLVRSFANAIVETIPRERPEIMPLEPHPTKELETYETSWAAHIRTLETLFNHE